MGQILITMKFWDAFKSECPCLDNLNRLCSAKHGQMDKVRCQFESCPFVFWLNILNIMED